MYQRILVPVDGSPTSNSGLAEAIRLAHLTNGRLRLVHVIDEVSFALPMDAYAGYAGFSLTALRENGAEILRKAKATVDAEGLSADIALHENFAGSVYELVAAEAAKWPADLIVIGTHGRRGVRRLLLGSSAENILRHATVPVLLVRMPQAAIAEPKEAVAASVHVSLPSAALAME